MNTRNYTGAALAAMILSALTFGTAYADISASYGATTTTSGTTVDAGAVSASNSSTINLLATSSVTMTRAYASTAGTINVGSSDSLVPTITADGEILAEDSGSTINLYGDAISITKGDDYTAAVTAQDGAVINIGTSSSSSITTSGEVLATTGEDGSSAGTVTLQAENITMYYNASANNDSDVNGGEDNTAMADEGGSLTITAGDTLTIEGPVGATGTGSTVTLLGNTIDISHNTLTTVKDDPESRGVYAEDGGTVTIGSDDTDTLTIDVENDSGYASVVVDGSDSTLNLYGDTISITATDGVLNGSVENPEDTNQAYTTDFVGGTLNIGTENTSSLTINGVLRTVGDGSSGSATTTLLGSSITADDVATYNGGITNIGSDNTNSVTLDAVRAFNGSTVTILGDTIAVEGEDASTDDSIDIVANSTVTIGSDDTSAVSVAGDIKVTADSDTYSGTANLTILGNNINLGTSGETGVALYQDGQGTVTIGDDETESVVSNSAILVQSMTRDTEKTAMTITGDTVTLNSIVDVYGSGRNYASLTIDGTNISQTLAEPFEISYAVEALLGGSLSIGSSRTENLTIAGEVASMSSEDGVDTEVNLDGQTITLENGAFASGNGASLTIGDAGVTQTLSGDLTATDEGVVTATLSGAYTGDALASAAGSLTLTAGSATGDLTSTGSGSTLTADISSLFTGDASAEDSGTLTLTAGSVVGDLSTSDSGVLTATVSNTFTGMTTDDADTMTLNLNSGATWNLTGSSTVSTLNADGANINLMDGTLGQTLTTDTFAGDGATVYLDADGTTNTGNDRIYVNGTHTGTTSLHLSSTSATWEGALGTVLASVGDEEGSFVSDGETEAALYYYNLELASTTDNVTDGYGTDWYLAGFTKSETNSEGYHTTLVRDLAGVNGSNYLMWRSGLDTLFRRLGEVDGTVTDMTDDGVWARVKGVKFSRDGEFKQDTRYNQVEVGYDWMTDEDEDKIHVAGVGIGYLWGDADYLTGDGDLRGYTLGVYDTQSWKNGQYLDLSFKVQRYKNEFDYYALGQDISGTLWSTGVSLGAEYGYKMRHESGLFFEPQAQLVVGYFKNGDYTDSEGVHSDSELIRTAVGRLGARLGYEGDHTSFYVKANWYHDFGGNGNVTFSAGSDVLDLHEDYGDTWFEYGLGAAVRINDHTQFYFDMARANGTHYDEDWTWDAGVRWSF
jgi:outer membrane autotransporter protein